ncbi:hypothetical protein MESS2_1000003 [Mesorhizobium metallidurans STM 2683]|uniref:Uncharacterized protein n=4 Tax=Mesorhizobium TaxID=68287 RepID=A0A2P9AU44_9HYPH|nr:Carbam_trans_N domain-containing protein [Mesorhizobium ventifaucium]CAH2399179.1 Carbam_trans_N domain-containing protein [Mesorhizobium escarrei]CCV02989.1 hypothetical protein MESS2_1000003 [Mesorhizobium metallidurans STM 2683]SJM34694.1 conserved hypothetical protein [Mesorhizobium delmotii]
MVLVRDGHVIATVEEERLNRIKLTNKLASGAIQHCLSAAVVQFKEIDRVAFYAAEAIVTPPSRRCLFPAGRFHPLGC